MDRRLSKWLATPAPCGSSLTSGMVFPYRREPVFAESHHLSLGDGSVAQGSLWQPRQPPFGSPKRAASNASGCLEPSGPLPDLDKIAAPLDTLVAANGSAGHLAGLRGRCRPPGRYGLLDKDMWTLLSTFRAGRDGERPLREEPTNASDCDRGHYRI